MFSIILTDALQGIKPPQLSHLIRKQRFSLSFRAKWRADCHFLESPPNHRMTLLNCSSCGRTSTEKKTN